MKSLKSIFSITAIFLMSLTTFAQNRIFSEFAGRKDIITVYISTSAMNLGLQIAGNNKDLGKVKDCIRNPQGLEIVTSEKATGKDYIRQALGKKIKKLNMELLLNTTSGENESVNIYTGELINDSIMKDVIIEVADGSEYTVIYIQGEIDTKKLTENVNKK